MRPRLATAACAAILLMSSTPAQAATVLSFDTEDGATYQQEGLWHVVVLDPFGLQVFAPTIIGGALSVGANQRVRLHHPYLTRITFMDLDGQGPIFIRGGFNQAAELVITLDGAVGLETLAVDVITGDYQVGNAHHSRYLTLYSPAAWRLDNVQTTTIPEPTAWAMMLAGFGLAGAALRRRRGHGAHPPHPPAAWPTPLGA
jgi:hypothetical protein